MSSTDGRGRGSERSLSEGSTRQGEAGTGQGGGRDSKGCISHVDGEGSGEESDEGSAQTDSLPLTGGAELGADSDQTSSHLTSPASSLSCLPGLETFKIKIFTKPEIESQGDSLS